VLDRGALRLIVLHLGLVLHQRVLLSGWPGMRRRLLCCGRVVHQWRMLPGGTIWLSNLLRGGFDLRHGRE
jgi:hypothetical protein